MYASICRLRLALSRHLRKWTYALVGLEISRISRYADRVVHVDPLPSDTGMLLEAIDAPIKQIGASKSRARAASGSDASTSSLFNGNSITRLIFRSPRDRAPAWGGADASSSRLQLVFRMAVRLADSVGLRGAHLSSRSSRRRTSNTCAARGIRLVRLRPVAYVPWHFFGLGRCERGDAAVPGFAGCRSTVAVFGQSSPPIAFVPLSAS